MYKNTQDILVAGGALLLPFLFKKDKQQKNTFNDLSRFDNYPNGSGELGGGYYDKLTQERIQEQAKKDSPLYFGDKGQNAIYDPFYDFNDSPVQANAITARDLSATDYEAAAKCVRVRIVPNSFFVSNTFSRELGKLKENHIYACVVEIFNPFPFAGVDSTKFKIDIEGITLQHTTRTSYELSDRGITATGRKNSTRGPFNVSYDTTGRNIQSMRDGLEYGIFNFYKNQADREGIYKDLPESLPGQTSVFLPVFLSYCPDKNGNVLRDNMPLYMNDGLTFYTYNSDHTEVTGTVAGALEQFEFNILLTVNTKPRIHTVIATNDNDSYSFTLEKSISHSHQDRQYFTLDSTPIYSRNDFWVSLFNQRELNLTTAAGGNAARSYWWSYNCLRDLSRFAPFGSVNLKFE
ncbi:MAG: hypothetical protein J6R22_02805 [Alphaproteobacteria bacterium]|nr:hypothetical protein [Alphaproteobacteria bacterium]